MSDKKNTAFIFIQKTNSMHAANTAFLMEAEQEWKDLGAGVHRQIMGYNDDLMLVKFRFEKGAVGAPHQHIHSQGAMVVSGVFELTINGQSKILRAGDGYFVEPNTLHGAVCLEAGILVDAFSPVRNDFL
jgi:quercetin dioxygenase-like cupin family protein